MKKILKTNLIYNIILLLIVLSAIVGTVDATTLTVDQSGGPGIYTTIQSAIDSSSIGDTINVDSGIYNEYINVYKQLTIIGIDTGNGKPNIRYIGTTDIRPVSIRANGVTFDGFNITNGLHFIAHGCALCVYSDNNVIQNNIVSNNDLGGIHVVNSHNNLIRNNVLSHNNDSGITLTYYTNDPSNSSSHNTITDNIIDHDGTGIDLINSSYNMISNNDINNNSQGIGISQGMTASQSTGNNFSGNDIHNNRRYGIFLSLSTGNNFSGNDIHNNNWTGFEVSNSSYNMISYNGIRNNKRDGIVISLFSTGNNFSGNNISKNNWSGINSSLVSDNTIIENTINYNNKHGIDLRRSSTHTIRQNTIKYNNNFGINLSNNSNSNIIADNDIANNIVNDISSNSSNNNEITGNNISNSNFGIIIQFSNSNTISNNTALNNYDTGIRLSDSDGNILTNNTATGGNCGISVCHSSSNAIDGNTANGNSIGISLWRESNSNQITDNDANSNTLLDTKGRPSSIGIMVHSSANNLVRNNTLKDNPRGIKVNSSSNNDIYNNIFNNTINFLLDNSTNNRWNTTETTGPNIIGGSKIAGNYWATPSNDGFSQTCINRGDGICNTEYDLDLQNIDYLPLTNNAYSLPNKNPVAEAGGPYTINEGSSVTLDGTLSTDPDGDPLTYAWDINNDGIYETQGVTTTMTPSDGPATITVGLQVSDGKGGISTDTVTINVNNVPPSVKAGPNQTVNEGDNVSFSGSFTDPGILDTHTIDWDFGDGSVASGILIPTHIYADNGIYIVKLKVTDKDGGIGEDSLRVTVNNVPPTIDSLSADPYLAQIGTTITGTGTFHDPGIQDTFTAIWNWDGSTNTINLPTGSVSTVDSHTYTTPGVYSTSLQITDKDGGSDIENMSQYIVIYDPNGGFVTGGGWINSPAGAYITDPTLTGKANFGFVSKYQKGATVPTGQTEFQFKVASLNFHSTSYDWLVVAGAKAQYKGSGTINGIGDYGFMLTAIDGQINGGGGTDKFRIKIWEKATGTIIYDNQNGATDDTDPTTVIAGGSIVIHK